MNSFHTMAALGGIDASAVLDAVLSRLREHELDVTELDGAWHIDYESAQIRFCPQGATLHAAISAPTQEALFDARMMVHHHLAEFSGREPGDILWEGDQPAFERPPAFRVLSVVSIQDISPHLRRVRFRGDNLARYEREEDIHCKLFLPQPGVSDPEWPTLGPDGMPRFPTGEKRLDMRTYTIRRIDAKAGWVEIDFIVHEDAGPGACWAVQAQPGQRIGLTGPGGRTARPAAWMLFAGDDTALPAIARITENLPPETRGTVIVEVQDAADEIPLALPAAMSLRWLHRGQTAAGTGTALRDAVLACTIPRDVDRYVWMAAEFSTVQTVRSWLRDTVGIAGKDQLVVAYWRHGMDETAMKSGGRRQAEAQSTAAEARMQPTVAGRS